MTHSYKILSATHDDVADEVTIGLALMEGKTQIDTRSLAFPASLSEKELDAELAKYAATYFADRDSAVVEVVKETERKETQKKLDQLIGKHSTV